MQEVIFQGGRQCGKAIFTIIEKSQKEIEKSLEEYIHLKDYSCRFIENNFRLIQHSGKDDIINTAHYFCGKEKIITLLLKSNNDKLEYEIIEHWKKNLN